MNIWFINQYAMPPDEAGGTRHHALSVRLAAAGRRPTIFACSLSYLTRKDRSVAGRGGNRTEIVDGVRYVWVQTPGYSDNGLQRLWSMVMFSLSLLRRRTVRGAGRPDVVVGSSPHPFGALAASMLARRYNVPFVLEVRDLWPQALIDEGGVSPHHPLVLLLRVIEKRLYRSAQLIITVMPGAANYLRRFGVPSSRVLWLPNGIDLKLVGPPTPEVADSVFTVMYAGAHGPANSLDTILDAAKMILREDPSRPIVFRLVGDGADKPRLVARCEAEAISNVEFVDPVPKTAVYDLLRLAGTCLLTFKAADVLTYGASPNKLFDYFGVARPVVFATAMANSLVDQAHAGFTVPAEDPGALAEAIVRLANMTPDGRAELGNAGRAFAEQNHSFDSLARQLEGALSELVRQGRATA